MKVYQILFIIGLIMVTYILTGSNIFWTGIILLILGVICALCDSANIKVNYKNYKEEFK